MVLLRQLTHMAERHRRSVIAAKLVTRSVTATFWLITRAYFAVVVAERSPLREEFDFAVGGYEG